MSITKVGSRSRSSLSLPEAEGHHVILHEEPTCQEQLTGMVHGTKNILFSHHQPLHLINDLLGDKPIYWRVETITGLPRVAKRHKFFQASLCLRDYEGEINRRESAANHHKDREISRCSSNYKSDRSRAPNPTTMENS